MPDLKKIIRTVPDFPKPGILFYDIGSLLADGPAWQKTVAKLADQLRPLQPEALIGIESRGFLVAAPIAAALGIGFAMVRKRGKLPGKTVQHSYTLEYGSDTIEIQDGMLKPGQRAILIDDLLATGGTAAAAIALARQISVNVIQASFIIELTFLNGRNKIDVPVTSLISYDS